MTYLAATRPGRTSISMSCVFECVFSCNTIATPAELLLPVPSVAIMRLSLCRFKLDLPTRYVLPRHPCVLLDSVSPSCLLLTAHDHFLQVLQLTALQSSLEGGLSPSSALRTTLSSVLTNTISLDLCTSIPYPTQQKIKKYT
uniref:Exosome complex component CSL4 n=1 Tax=Lygus hesperus TaxID=30085 RepID=A0A0A9VRG4_LYGHE